MLLNEEKITNAITLSTLKTDKFKSAVISVSLNIPLTKKNYAYNLILSHLMQRGTAKYPSNALLNKKLDELYGTYAEIKSHRISENIALTINAEILNGEYIPDGTDVLGGTIDVISELILSPAFTRKDFNPAFFEQEKKLIREAIDAEINVVRVYAAKRCTEAMQVNVDFPTSEELKLMIGEASIDELIAYYEYLLKNARLNIFYVGNDDVSELKKKIFEAFSNYPEVCPLPLTHPFGISRGDFYEASVEMPVAQGKLALGFSTGAVLSADSDDYRTAIMLNEIFGGSASSKLFLNVREKLGLCYYCSSSYSPYSGIMLVSSGFDVKNRDIAQAEILKQLEEIRNGNISDAELNAARKSLSNGYRQLYDSPFDLQAFFGDRALFDINETVEEAMEKLTSVTKEDIAALARKIKWEASFYVKGTKNSATEEEDYD